MPAAILYSISVYELYLPFVGLILNNIKYSRLPRSINVKPIVCFVQRYLSSFLLTNIKLYSLVVIKL